MCDWRVSAELVAQQKASDALWARITRAVAMMLALPMAFEFEGAMRFSSVPHPNRAGRGQTRLRSIVKFGANGLAEWYWLQGGAL